VWLQAHWGRLVLAGLCRLFEDIAFRGADALVVVSEVLKRDLIAAGVPADRIVVNPNGVDTERFHPGVEGGRVRRELGLSGKIVAGLLGTFGVWHGVPVLDGFFSAARREPRLHLLLVGDGPKAGELVRRVREAGVADRVTRTGLVSHERVPEHLAACDMLLSPHVPCADGLGSGPVPLGERIDWHRDFKSGRTWPPVYHRDVRVVDLADDSDIKVVWELSRFTHLLALGKAYAYTGDKRYAVEVAAQVSDWIAANPPQTGPNWACAMEVAIRAVHWIWAYELIRPAPALSPAFQVELLKSVLAHGRFIHANLEYCETPGLVGNERPPLPAGDRGGAVRPGGLQGGVRARARGTRPGGPAARADLAPGDRRRRALLGPASGARRVPRSVDERDLAAIPPPWSASIDVAARRIRSCTRSSRRTSGPWFICARTRDGRFRRSSGGSSRST
jgi:hypothetical protein